MIPTGTPPTTDHPTLTSARALHMILELARVEKWPMPFKVEGWESERIVLQFRSRREVNIWAVQIGGEFSPPGNPHVRATGTLLDTQVTVCAFVPEAVA